LHTAVLIGGMSLLLAFISRLLLGPDAWWWMFFTLFFAMIFLPRVSPYWLLRLFRAQPLSSQQAPQLTAIVEELAERAELPQPPALFWIPSHTTNSVAVGSRKQSAIAVTEGLLRLLNRREMIGVLAHEVSHIRNNDLRIMTLADLISRMTHMLSMFGLLMLFFSLPLIVTGAVSFSMLGLILLIISPSISALLQLGLSRVREFDADLEAARLSADPQGLASALIKIDQQQVSLWRRIVMPGYHEQQPSILRTHPQTSERVNRLMELSGPRVSPFYPMDSEHQGNHHNPDRHVVIGRPRHRFFSGTWR
jgi:heat shock protein HtpX